MEKVRKYFLMAIAAVTISMLSVQDGFAAAAPEGHDAGAVQVWQPQVYDRRNLKVVLFCLGPDKTPLASDQIDDIIEFFLRFAVVGGDQVGIRFDRPWSGIVLYAYPGGSLPTLPDSNSKLISASSQGDIPVVVYCIASGADIGAVDVFDRTPLHWASSKGHADAVRFLIASGADIRATDNNRWTPLHLASLFGHTEVVFILLGAGANIEAVDDIGMTPLHHASIHGFAGVVELLIASGADVRAADNFGNTPLYFASFRGNTEVVSILKKHQRWQNIKKAGKVVAGVAGLGAVIWVVIKFVKPDSK